MTQAGRSPLVSAIVFALGVLAAAPVAAQDQGASPPKLIQVNARRARPR